MYQALLRNKWLLLACAVLVLASVQFFAGSNGDPLSGMEIATREDEPQPPSEPVPEETHAPVEQDYGDVEFVSDEELIDSAEGFDPTPAEESFGDGSGGDFDEESFTSYED